MKKYYIITLIAIASIACLQATYILNSYNDYIEKILTKTEELLHLSINSEFRKRTVDIKTARGTKHPKLKYYKSMNKMTRQELDSLLDIMHYQRLQPPLFIMLMN